MAASLDARVLERLAKPRELALPADESRFRPPIQPARGHADHQVRCDGLALALGKDRLGWLAPDLVADELERRLAHENRTRRRGLLETRRDIHGIAGDECGPGVPRPSDNRTRVDAHAELDAHAPLAGQLDVELADGVTELDGGAYRAERIVFVDRWDAEYGHDRVADELLDCAAVPLDDGAGPFEVAGQQATQRFGVQLLAQRRRPDHICEQDRDDSTRATRSSLTGVQRGRTFKAELGPLWVLGAAVRANDHRRGV